MTMVGPYPHHRAVRHDVAVGAVVGVMVVLGWRWARAGLLGAAVVLAIVGALRLVTTPSGRYLDTQLVLAVLLGFHGVPAGIVIWWRRSGRPRLWPVFVAGGLLAGALIPFALVGASPALGLAATVVGAVVGLVWALVRREAHR